MIRKTCITLCLLLAAATAVIDITSRQTELVISGRDRYGGIESSVERYIDSSLLSCLGTRISFLRGKLVHATTYVNRGAPGVTQDADYWAFRWSRWIDRIPGPIDGPETEVMVHRLSVPLWRPLVLFLVYPAIALLNGPIRRSVRGRRGLCLTCGYNLAGNTSGICPECGGPT